VFETMPFRIRSLWKNQATKLAPSRSCLAMVVLFLLLSGVFGLLSHYVFFETSPTSPTPSLSEWKSTTVLVPNAHASSSVHPPLKQESKAEFEETLYERFLFRTVLIGCVTTRTTWVLFRSPNRQSLRLQVFLQEMNLRAMPNRVSPVQLSCPTGWEYHEPYWESPTMVEYQGTRTGTAPETYQLVLQSASESFFEPDGSLSWFEGNPKRFRMKCKFAPVAVRAAKTNLRFSTVLRFDEPFKQASWFPNAQEITKAWSCEFLDGEHVLSEPTDTDRWKPGGTWRPPFFLGLQFVAPSSRSIGIEWLYADADASYQEKTYRWIPHVQNIPAPHFSKGDDCHIELHPTGLSAHMF
jgi:hypothetical protein